MSSKSAKTIAASSTTTAAAAPALSVVDCAAEDEEKKPYRIEFFLAPWRRAGDKGAVHYLSLGTACAVYLFIVGGTLTYLTYLGDDGTPHSGTVMGIPSAYLGPIFIALGSLIVVSAVGLLTLCVALHFNPVRRKMNERKAQRRQTRRTRKQQRREEKEQRRRY